MSKKPDTAESLLRELALHLRHDADVNGSIRTCCPYGMLVLSAVDGDLWKRVIDVLGREPDMIRDVILPAMLKKTGSGSP